MWKDHKNECQVYKNIVQITDQLYRCDNFNYSMNRWNFSILTKHEVTKFLEYKVLLEVLYG